MILFFIFVYLALKQFYHAGDPRVPQFFLSATAMSVRLSVPSLYSSREGAGDLFRRRVSDP